jgi:hypothetical protein
MIHGKVLVMRMKVSLYTCYHDIEIEIIEYFINPNIVSVNNRQRKNIYLVCWVDQRSSRRYSDRS